MWRRIPLSGQSLGDFGFAVKRRLLRDPNPFIPRPNKLNTPTSPIRVLRSRNFCTLAWTAPTQPSRILCFLNEIWQPLRKSAWARSRRPRLEFKRFPITWEFGPPIQSCLPPSTYSAGHHSPATKLEEEEPRTQLQQSTVFPPRPPVFRLFTPDNSKYTLQPVQIGEHRNNPATGAG